MRPISIEIEEKTVELAIKVALVKLKARRREVDIEILAEGEKGLFGMSGGKPAKVKVTLKGQSLK